MRREVVAQLVFGELDAWRDRFFAVAQAQEAHTLVLHDSAEVPRWLRARSAERRVDPWERGGRWVLQLAQTWDAGRKTLLALWDGQADAGGTAQMVRLARQTGAMSVDPIDAKLLLEG